MLPVFVAVMQLAAGTEAFCDEHAARLAADSEDDLDADADVPNELEDRERIGFDILVTPKPEWLPWLHTIRSCSREHIHPPAALASGHRGLHAKTAAETHTNVSCRLATLYLWTE